MGWGAEEGGGGVCVCVCVCDKVGGTTYFHPYELSLIFFLSFSLPLRMSVAHLQVRVPDLLNIISILCVSQEGLTLIETNQ